LGSGEKKVRGKREKVKKRKSAFSAFFLIEKD